MANTLLTPTMITREALRILHQKLRFIGSVNRQYDKRFAQRGAKIGSQLEIRLPNEYTVRTGRTYAGQDTTEQKTTLTVATQKGVDMSFYSDELTLSLDDFSSRIIEPAMAVLAANIEADALTMSKDIYNAVGTPGTTPAAMTTVLNAGRKLTEYLAPEGMGRTLLINPAANVAMVNALSSLFHSGKEIASQYREGRIGNALGFDWYESTHTPVLTTGSRDNTTPIVGSISGASLACTGFDGAATIKKGDVFTIGSVYAVHPETKTAYDFLQQFTVTADATADGGGAVTLTISPEPIASGARQNVDAAPQASAALTFAGSASTNYPINLAYHKDAFAFVTADLERYKNQQACEIQRYDGISMRYWQNPDIRSDELLTRLDVLYGFKTVRPQLATRVWG